MPALEAPMNDMSIRSAGATPTGISGQAVENAANIELSIGGMDCPHCPPKVETALRAVAGVSAAHVNLANGSAHVAYDASRTKIIDLVKAIRGAGYSAGAAKMRVHIKNMHCASCVVRIELALRTTPGVVAATASA